MIDLIKLKKYEHASFVYKYLLFLSDGVACERAIELAANTKNICYIRTTRPKTPIIYPNDEQFNVNHLLKYLNFICSS